MNNKPDIITLTPENTAKYGCPCFLNPKNEGHLKKLEWLRDRFSEGLIIKHLLIEGEKKSIGFIEYVPGEYAWRAVDAGGYLFIHCIWISPNKFKEKGYGSLLVEECINDAKMEGKYGVAVVASSGPFMAGKEIFIKNGFEIIEKSEDYDLLAKTITKAPPPRFNAWERQLSKHDGLNIIYSNQCPWVARSIPELEEITRKNGLDLRITELKTPEQAQNAPSVYSVFNLVYNGRLIIDHYISSTRFINILKKELKLIE
jgi:ribosomal protein S18 acetylase RimI-like enzyme